MALRRILKRLIQCRSFVPCMVVARFYLIVNRFNHSRLACEIDFYGCVDQGHFVQDNWHTIANVRSGTYRSTRHDAVACGTLFTRDQYKPTCETISRNLSKSTGLTM